MDRSTETMPAREFVPAYMQYLFVTWLGVAFLCWAIAWATGYASDRFDLALTTLLCGVALVGVAATYRRGSLRSPITWGSVTALVLIEMIFAIATFTS